MIELAPDTPEHPVDSVMGPEETRTHFLEAAPLGLKYLATVIREARQQRLLAQMRRGEVPAELLEAA